eukprot:2299542-Karenia_brevis.AAC.1
MSQGSAAEASDKYDFVNVLNSLADKDRDKPQLIRKEEQRHPVDGDSILVFKEKWLQLVLNGEKTIEIRGQKMQCKRYWLAHKQTIKGEAEIVRTKHVKTLAQWRKLIPNHHVHTK